jgi:ribosomal protein S18 acetylase RimI-like enzyme
VAIRPALAGDAESIGLVHVRSWQASYRGQFPQEFLDQLDPAQRAEGWRRYFAEASWERQTILVVEVDSTVVGFANVGPSRDSDARGEGEVRAIYLLPERWAQGLGRDLMAAAAVALNDSGFAEAVLWVLESNERARRFYEGCRMEGGRSYQARREFRVSNLGGAVPSKTSLS